LLTCAFFVHLWATIVSNHLLA